MTHVSPSRWWRAATSGLGISLRWARYQNAAGAWWRETGSTRLKAFSPYAWIPVLAVASLSLLVSFCNYRLQLSVRPDIEFTNGSLDAKGRTLLAYWHNPGKVTAWRGRAEMFDVDDKGLRADKPFASVGIYGAGQKVFAGMGAQTLYEFPPDKPLPDEILVCATYSDENERTYDQAYLLAVQKTASSNIRQLIEQLPPFKPNCP